MRFYFPLKAIGDIEYIECLLFAKCWLNTSAAIQSKLQYKKKLFIMKQNVRNQFNTNINTVAAFNKVIWAQFFNLQTQIGKKIVKSPSNKFFDEMRSGIEFFFFKLYCRWDNKSAIERVT